MEQWHEVGLRYEKWILSGQVWNWLLLTRLCQVYGTVSLKKIPETSAHPQNVLKINYTYRRILKYTNIIVCCP